MPSKQSDKPKRGFAAMSAEQRREIAARGGAAVKPEDRAFSRDPDAAARAGRLGGSRPKK